MADGWPLFAELDGSRGDAAVGDGSRIVVYDSAGIFSAARVWWTFRVMGVEDVTVLNGGLSKWKREGLPLESGERALEIVRRLGTSATQLYRLLDQTNYRKSVDQLLRLLNILECDVDLVVRAKSA